MAQMEKRNQKNFFVWLASATVYNSTWYASFEDEWNKQCEPFNSLYDKGTGITKNTLQSLLKTVTDHLKGDKPDYHKAHDALATWSEILPKLSSYCDAYNQVTQKQRDLSKYRTEASKCTSTLSSIDRKKKATAQDFVDATGQVNECLETFLREVAYADYVTAFDALTEKYEELKDDLPKLKSKYDPLVDTVDESDLRDKIETEAKKVAETQTLLSNASTYLEKRDAVETEYESLKSVHPTSGKLKDQAEQSNKQLAKDIAAAKNVAENNLNFVDSIELLEQIAKTLAEQRKNRVKAVCDEAAQNLKSSPQKAVFEKLKGSSEPNGLEIAAALYLQFPGKDFALFLKGIDVQDDDSDSSKAANHLIKLSQSIGVEGIRTLCDAFSGSGSRAEEGSQGVGVLLQKGVSDEQIGKLFETFKDPNEKDKLKNVLIKGFSGDSELFASVFLKGLAGKSSKDNDLRINNLKRLVDSFGNNEQLGKLISGLASEKGETSPNSNKEAAGDRMNALLRDRFNGDPRKLKNPFFDNLNCTTDQLNAWRQERDKLQEKLRVFTEYNLLSEEEKKKKSAPGNLTSNEAKRLQHLNKNVFGEYPYTPLDLKTMIRNATTFKKQRANGHQPTDLQGCDIAKMDHYIRHSRQLQQFEDDHLAPEDATTSVQVKVTSLWPESVGDKEIAKYVDEALEKASIPSKSDLETAGDNRKFVFVNISGGYRVKIGFKLKRAKIIVDQFYPVSGPDVETIDFYDMHAIKKALAFG